MYNRIYVIFDKIQQIQEKFEDAYLSTPKMFVIKDEDWDLLAKNLLNQSRYPLENESFEIDKIQIYGYEIKKLSSINTKHSLYPFLVL